MGFARRRALLVTADGASNQTAYISLKKGGIVTISSGMVGQVTLQRRDAAGTVTDVTNNLGEASLFTLPGTYTIVPAKTQAEYRLNAKNGEISGFPFTMSIEGS